MKRILIIEDELEMLRNLTTILRLEKFRPLSAENGRIGVDLAKKQKPDLILCDVSSRGGQRTCVFGLWRGLGCLSPAYCWRRSEFLRPIRGYTSEAAIRPNKRYRTGWSQNRVSRCPLLVECRATVSR